MSKQGFNKFKASKGTQKLVKIYLEDIFKRVEVEFCSKLTEIKGILSVDLFSLVKIMINSNLEIYRNKF